jgi:aspartate/methionine/tyrosine aminotransferase
MTLKIAKRATVPPFIVMDVLRAANEQAAAGEAVFHLELGQPGTPAPMAIRNAAKAALDDNVLGYTDAFGLPELRQKIAGHYTYQYGVKVDPDRVVVTTGSSTGFILAFLGAFEPGDRVALASPGYPCYRNILTALGVEPVLLLTGPETNFQPSPEALDRLEGTIDGLIVASPSNPTGTIMHRDKFSELIDYCDRKEIRFISDEIYHGITFGEKAETALAFTNDAIIVNSFSKYFSMTGWRLGWMILPEDMLRSAECLAQNLFISPPTLSQYAAVAAFDCYRELDGNVAEYAKNRALLLEELPKAGFTKLAPAEGAFYIYADVTELTNDSVDYCRRLLVDTGVATTPGIDFDPDRGSKYMRFSFAGPFEHMIEATKRIYEWRNS